MNDRRSGPELDTQIMRRAALAAGIRQFFAKRKVVEVMTPLISAGVTDVHIDSTRLAEGGFLRTSPEYSHKRLLASGVGDLYELGPVFRHGEHGRNHRSEFWMAEWYRIGWEAPRLAEEVIELIREVGPDCDWTVRDTTWQQLGTEALGFDPLDADTDRIAQALGDAPDGLDRSGLYDWLLATRIQPRLPAGQLTVVHRFPAAQAALARISPGDPRTAERFEIFAGPLELANGYHELTDPEEQRLRFDHDNAERRRLGRPEMPIDQDLIEAMEIGLPDCAGVALGFERLLMAIHDLDDISSAASPC